jgi:hypothetical protein
MGVDVVIDARVNKETAIWNDGAGTQLFSVYKMMFLGVVS